MPEKVIFSTFTDQGVNAAKTETARKCALLSFADNSPEQKLFAMTYEQAFKDGWHAGLKALRDHGIVEVKY
jgi:hypothetical protein